MTLANLQLPGPADLTYQGIWHDEIAANNAHYTSAGDGRFAVGNAPATEAHFVIRSQSENKQIVVSILNTFKGCTIAATDTSGTRIKRCPAKLALFRAGDVEIIDAGTACYVEYGAVADIERNAPVAAYDPETRSVRLAALFQGEIEDACLVNVPLPSTQQAQGVTP
jgi:hypothetical protein